MVPTKEDLVQLVDIDRLVFQEETLILPDDQQKRFAFNPEVMHVLKDGKTNQVMGGITMSPLRPDVLQKLINLEYDETDIKPEDYRSYTTDHPQDCYVVGIIARPGLAEKYYASRLLYSTLAYLLELLERGIIIRRIYTVATTDSGDKLAQDMGFTRLPGEWTGEHEDFRRPYVLYLDAKDSKSTLVRRYLKHKRNLERRRKRYEKQAAQVQE